MAAGHVSMKYGFMVRELVSLYVMLPNLLVLLYEPLQYAGWAIVLGERYYRFVQIFGRGQTMQRWQLVPLELILLGMLHEWFNLEMQM